MSAGDSLPIAHATELARQVSERLTPYVARLKCAGSIRRQRRFVSDIEFVAEPYMDEDLVGGKYPNLGYVRRELLDLGDWSKGGDRMMQVVNALGVEGLKLEIYLAHPPAAWGSILAIRTGPWQLGEYVVTKMKAFGYRHVDGHAERIDTGEVVSTDDEEDFFALAQVPCVPPRQRDALKDQLIGG